MFNFLAEDARNGWVRSSEIAEMSANSVSYNVAVAETTEELVDKMEFAEVDNFPADFQKAWEDHTNAWRNYSEYLNDIRDAETTASKVALKKYDAEITRTYLILLKVGRSYDANIKYIR
jgi:hypothetical protein